MEKGDVLFVQNYTFRDQGESDKLIILLNDPQKNGSYLYVLTTSKKWFRKDIPGCHHERGESYYVIRENDDFLDIRTWVLLDRWEQKDNDEFKSFCDVKKPHSIGRLKDLTIKQLTNCFKKSDHIPGFVADLVLYFAMVKLWPGF